MRRRSWRRKDRAWLSWLLSTGQRPSSSASMPNRLPWLLASFSAFRWRSHRERRKAIGALCSPGKRKGRRVAFQPRRLECRRPTPRRTRQAAASLWPPACRTEQPPRGSQADKARAPRWRGREVAGRISDLGGGGETSGGLVGDGERRGGVAGREAQPSCPHLCVLRMVSKGLARPCA